MRWLLLLFVLALAMLLGPVLTNNPGYIKLVLAGYSIEMTLLGLGVTAFIVAAVLWLVLKIVKKLLKLQQVSFNFFRWRKQRKAQQAFESGLQAYAKQQWQQASQDLSLATQDDFMAQEKRMLASYAALYAGDHHAAEQQAALIPENNANRWFVQADIQLQQQQSVAATELLADKIATEPKDKALGQLYLYALQQAGHWQQLLSAVPLALKYQWFEKEQWHKQRFNIYPAAISQLSLQRVFDEQADYWQALPAKERKSAAALTGRAWAMAQTGQPEPAEKLLTDALSLHDVPQLLPYLRQIPLGRSVLKLRKQLQHWLHSDAENGYLYAALACLAEHEGDKAQADLLWQKARRYEPKLTR